jgi:hypothetical protein
VAPLPMADVAIGKLRFAEEMSADGDLPTPTSI